MVESPVLFVTFARPEYARKSFDAIKLARPKKLYFYSNMGREEKFGEIERNNEIRKFISEINWDCDLQLFFRKEYVDIYTSLRGAIDWIFSNEEQAIIIEEDCVATPAFFSYCDNLLIRYKFEPQVWMLSGNNFTPKANPVDLSYFFSKYMHIYGWASWADRWKMQDKMMQEYKKLSFIDIIRYYQSPIKAIVSRLYWNKVFNEFEIYNPWDHIFTYNMVKNKAYSVIPSKNLVNDIGAIGVHHNSKSKENLEQSYDIVDSLDLSSYPSAIKPTNYDNYHFWTHIFIPLIKRKFLKLRVIDRIKVFL